MTEEQKELLKEKLKQLFDEKIDSLTNKFQTDINTIETLKYSYFDNVVLPFREIEEKEKEKEKEKSEEPKEKEDRRRLSKKPEEEKTFKKLKPLTLKEKNLAKTPLKPNKKRDLGFKQKTEMAPKKTTKMFDKKKEKEKEKVNTSKIGTERLKKKNLTTLDVTKKGPVRSSKTPFNKRGRKTDEDKEDVKSKTIRGTAFKATTTKRFTGKGKTIEKKGKNDKKKVEKGKEKKKEENIKEEAIEEKKEVVLKDKTIIKRPDEMKDNDALFNIYLVLKGNYLTNQEKYKIITENPTIYKCFGSNISFLLDEKKQNIRTKITELETFLNKYGDLESYLKKEFEPSKSAQNSLVFVKKDEIEKIIKKGDIPIEINKIIKLLFYLFDVPFDENLQNENLLNFFIQEIMDKNNVKDLKTFATNYLSNHKDLNITQEKFDKINAIISSDEKVLSSVDIAKICRNISYCTLLIKESYEFINTKNLDDVPLYELKFKNKLLQEYKKQLASLENKGVPPKEEENTKVNEDIVPKESQE